MKHWWMCVLCVGCASQELSTSSAISPIDLSPDGRENGRVNNISIDPNNRLLAYAVANGGVYVSEDGGVRWKGNHNRDGSPGEFGNGLDRGLTLFDTIAVDPFDGSNILLMVDDDNRVLPLSGIWRSRDGGRHFDPVDTNRCSNRERLYAGQIRFSQTMPGLVVATSVCGLSISFDSGAVWYQVALGGTTSAPNPTEGLDFLEPGGNFFGHISSIGLAGFCLWTLDPSTGFNTKLQVGIYDPGTGELQTFTPPQPPLTIGNPCSFAFDPRNARHFFVAGGGADATRVKGIFEGLAFSPTTVSWTDLNPPGFGARDLAGNPGPNGRPAFVQVHRSGTNIRIYYHDTVELRYEDCSSTFSCPVGAAFDPAHKDYEQCPHEDPAGPWHCVPLLHSDSSAIAFDPTKPFTPCPQIISGDGGNQISGDCGDSWGYAYGIDTLTAYEAAVTGTASSRRIWLANLDDGLATRATDGTWSFGGGDAFAVDAIRTTPEEHVQSDNSATDHVAVVNDGPSPYAFTVPVLPARMLVGISKVFAPRYYSDYLLAAVNSSSLVNTFQLMGFDTTSGASGPWFPISPELAPKSGTVVVGGAGDLAIGGRLVPVDASTPAVGRTFYIILPTTVGNQLVCLRNGRTLDYATGPANPVRVWASEGDDSYAYVYNSNPPTTPSGPPTTDVYVSTPARGRCVFARDDLASDLLTRSHIFKGYDDPADLPYPMATVGFHPGDNNRAAIATVHNGTLVTLDHGTSWSVSHAFPEPYAYPTSIFFDNVDPATDEILMSANGRGIWSIDFGAGSARYYGLVRVDPAGILHASVGLFDSTGSKSSGHAARFFVHDRSPQSQLPDIELQTNVQTDANGVATLAVHVDLPPGQYDLTTMFDRGPQLAQVWVRTQFVVRQRPH